MKTIGLLECDDVAGRFPHIQGGYREMFAALLPDFRFQYYEAHLGRLPESPDKCDAWICTGSKYSVYEQHDWLSRLSSFIRGIQGSDKPFVGICFGHQLLAHALGGEVAKAAQGWGVGVLPVEVLKEEPWMEPARREVRIQHMHQDQVERLPEAAALLGSGEHCEVALFCMHGTMLGIEGHPEFPSAYNRALIENRIERIGTERAGAALASLERPTDEAAVGGWIARFLQSA